MQEATLGDEARRRGEAVLGVVRSLQLNSPRILEIGCGNGWFAAKLSAIGPVYGVDISDAAIEEARRTVKGVTFEAGDFLEMDPEPGSFDIVVTLETLSHVPDQQKLIARAANVLRPGGYIIIATQNRTIYLRREGIQPPARGQLRRWLTVRQLRELLQTSFNVVKIRTMEPNGNKGFLRVVNSYALNSLLRRFFSEDTIRKVKENLGLGQTIIALAQKPNPSPYKSNP